MHFSGDKNIDVVHAFVAAGGVPAVSLSNSKSFIFNLDLCAWYVQTVLLNEIKGNFC